ncbi:YetF domain-containing protein [Chungangia koreensis]|uniref:YetF domain-containing protein n=1 Tax=Chungangia koreensis TaxID=752657 RepID=A0ABV8X352_9LACT
MDASRNRRLFLFIICCENYGTEVYCPTPLKVAPTAFSLPVIVIREGKVDLHELKKAGQNEDWLRLKVRELQQKEIKEILLATITREGDLIVYPY